MENIILASTSTLYGEDYLAYLLPTVAQLFQNCDEVLFIPYARPGGISYEDYTKSVQQTFLALNIHLKGLHQFDDYQLAIQNAQGIFTGGGNTFLLLKTLYEKNIIPNLRTVINSGTPYLGCSAGSNIIGKTINNTNDMPIVYPPSFEALSILNFNINPHYLDPIPNLKHNGESRETRIIEFLLQHNSIPVVGLREGSWLEIKGKIITLQGEYSARIFERNDLVYELPPKSLIVL